MSGDHDGGVRILPGTGRIDPLAILEAAKNNPGGFNVVVVVGWDSEGNLFLSSSETSIKEMHWLLSAAIDDLWNEIHKP